MSNLVDHLAAFIAIAETASFSQGARRLKCSVSAMSYSLAKLEEQYGFPLLKRGSGPTELTPAGRMLFRNAQVVVESARTFAARAHALNRGEETRIRLAVDSMLGANTQILDVLAEFETRHRGVTVQVFSLPLDELWEHLQTGAADVGLGALRDVPADIEGRPITSIKLIPVAAKHHALAKQKDCVSLFELRRSRQLCHVSSPRSNLERRGQHFFSTDVWTSSDLELLRAMIKRGFGWGIGTKAFFREELASGELVELDCPDVHFLTICQIGFVWPTDQPPGPLGRELLQAFTAKPSAPPEIALVSSVG